MADGALQRLLSLPLYSMLADREQWLRWNLKENANGRRTKMPDASTRAPEQWRTLFEVPAAPIDMQSGIGFVLTDQLLINDDWPLLCVDIDACRDPRTGAVEPWADEVLNVSGRSYAEISPSGYGLHLWVIARDSLFALGQRTRTVLKAGVPAGCEKKPEIQVFGTGPACYVTMTGDHYIGSGLDVRAV